MFQLILFVNARKDLKVMVKSCVQMLTSVLVPVPVVLMRVALIFLETILVSVKKDLKEIHMMDVVISMSVQIQMPADLERFVQILRAVIAAIALKVSMEMLVPKAVLITTNALVHHVVEMLTVQMKSVHLDALVLKALKVMQ